MITITTETATIVAIPSYSIIFSARSSSRDREKRDNYKKSNSKGGKKNPLKLHVGNLPLTTSEEEVRYRFEKYIKVCKMLNL